MSTPTTARTTPLSRTVWILVIARAANRLGAFTLPFLMITLVEEFDATLAEAGWVLAGFGLATIPSRLFGGRLSDTIGAKATIVVGLMGTAVAQLAIAGAQSLVQAIVAAVTLGLFFEIYEPPSQSMIADVTPPEQHPAAYGLLAAAMAAAGMGAGLLAAALAHFDLRWLFVVDAATCLACAAVVLVLLPHGRRTGTNDTDTTNAWRDRRLLTMLGLGTAFAAIYLQITIALPLTLSMRGLEASTLGLLLTLSAVTITVGQPILRRSALGQDHFTTMAIGYVLLAAGLLLNGLATTLPAFALATVVWSLGDLLLLGHAYSIVAALASENSRGRYMAVYGISWGLAAIIAPPVGTQLLEHTGPTTTWIAVAGGAALLAALQPFLRRQFHTLVDPDRVLSADALESL